MRTLLQSFAKSSSWNVPIVRASRGNPNIAVLQSFAKGNSWNVPIVRASHGNPNIAVLSELWLGC